MAGRTSAAFQTSSPDDAGIGQPIGGMMSSPAPVNSERLPERLWYACYTRGRHEKHVDRFFRERGIESYLPLVPLRRKWNDRLKIVKLPMFPSYLFCRVGRDEIWQVRKLYGEIGRAHV